MSARGFTMVELLVAMLLFVGLGAGGFAAWTRGNAAWREAAVEQILHERAQYVFASLEPELQMAGYFGQYPARPLAAASVPVAARDCGIELVQRLERPVEVAAAYQLPCVARGGGAVAGSQQLTVRRVSVQPAAAASGRAQWLSSPVAGELTWNITAAAPAPAPAGMERRDLLLRVYYVACNADGDAATPALRMKSLTSVAGNPAFVDTEVMPGVEALQAELFPAAPSAGRLRLTLTLRTDQADARHGQVRRITVTREFALRNAHGD
jgi:prepilin-type N-terminal cleavage/methylation domain-containing protein